MLHQIKAPQFYTDLDLQKTVLNPLANGKFKDFSMPLSVFQVLFKANPLYSSSFQACANPAKGRIYQSEAHLLFLYDHASGNKKRPILKSINK